MLKKTAPLQNRIGNFDSRFGWSRRIQPNGKYPEYTLWRIFKGMRYTVYCSLFASDRRVIADELRLLRIYLKNAIDYAAGRAATLDLNTRKHVQKTRYVRNQVERESEYFGRKNDQYFCQWVGKIEIALKNRGYTNEKIEVIFIDNNDWLRRCCERLVSIESIVNQILEVDQARIRQRYNENVTSSK